jgi:proline iminopeptidase
MSGTVDPSSVREARVPVAGAELWVRDAGRGTPIVVLHGGPDFDHQYLLPDFDRVAGAYRRIYYAQRGRGASRGAVRPEDVTIASEIADLEELRAHLGLETTALCGHSWGGLLAMEYALRHPGRVSHLILMNSGPASHADFVKFREHLRSRWPEESARMAALRLEPGYATGDVAAEAAVYRLHYGRTIRDPKRLERLLPSLRANFTPEAIRSAREIEDRLMSETWLREGYDLLPALGDLRVPTLVIHGEHDFVPEETIQRIARAIPGARYARIAGSGHFSYLDAPDPVRKALEEFLG